MKHLLSLVTGLFIASLSCTAQSAISIGLDGGHILLIGAQVKYTYTIKKIQLGAFVIPTMSNYYSWAYITRFGFCINSVPVNKKDASLYYGFAAEGYSEHGKSPSYIDKAVLVGLHLGVNVKLLEQLYFNSEWGGRAGFLFTQEYYQSPGAASHGYPGKYSETRENIFYLPVFVGITYQFGKKKIP